MPFIGRDWRSPGEAWVKTETFGWQRMKIIESQLHPPCHQSLACSWPPKSQVGQHMVQHCQRHDNIDSSEARGSLSSSNASTSISSPETSPKSSASVSPLGSPEKNIHHIHPITISSPYGQYSCCRYRNESSNISTLKANQSFIETNDNLLSAQPSPSLSLRTLQKNITPSDGVQDTHSTNLKSYKESDSKQSSCPSSPSNFSTGIDQAKSNKLDNQNSKQCRFDITDSIDPPLQESSSDRNPLQSTTNCLNCCCCSSVNGVSIAHCEHYGRNAPHCRISVRTREVAMYNTISEAFYSLDFCNAIHDIRRFNYICKLLHLLITQNLTSLSGCATRVLFTMLEQVAWEVSSNKRDIHVLKNLLNELRFMIQRYYCWGRPIGSSQLWQQHFETIERISRIVDGIELTQPSSQQQQKTFEDLPVEMIREILLRLSDYRDLINSARASPVMRTMIDGQFIWKRLCNYHFTDQQVKLALSNGGGILTRKSNYRGIKYARTSSPNGTKSFRNPVKSKVPSKEVQANQTGTHRNSLSKEGTSKETNSSYVTRAIKIFDSAGSVMNAKSGQSEPTRKGRSCRNVNFPATHKENQSHLDKKLGQYSQPNTSNRSSQEIDWEHVFHQLRKKFDLKEEYADCLLLCRHCRCLFWKSFGHPCIKSDDDSSEKFKLAQAWGMSHCRGCCIRNVCDCDRLNRNEDAERGENGHGEQANPLSRVSVAALSRNFDCRPRNLGGLDERENSESQPGAPVQQYALNENDAQFSSRPLSQLNVGPELRQRAQFLRLARGGGPVINDNRNEENNDVLQGRLNPTHDGIVPKHVAISPQAFLKFFSL